MRLPVIQEHKSPAEVNCIDDNSSQVLAISRGKGDLVFLDPRSDTLIGQEHKIHKRIRDLKFSPGDPNLLSFCYSDRVVLFDIRTLSAKKNLAAHNVA